MPLRLSMAAGLAICAALGQTAPTPPAFEAAAIKVNKSGGIRPEKERFLPGGRIELGNATLKEMIAPIYGVKSNMILGGPKWFDSERFDIVAKAPPDTPVPMLIQMVRTLIEERFQLKYHHEDKVMPVYALMVGKGPSKLKKSEGGGRGSCNSRPGDNGDVIHRECHNVTMSELVRQLGLGGYFIDERPVVDQTELAGGYDFDFEYSRPRPPANGDGPPEFTGPTIFEALTKVGLKLEPGKHPVPMMVIDRAQLPVE